MARSAEVIEAEYYLQLWVVQMWKKRLDLFKAVIAGYALWHTAGE